MATGQNAFEFPAYGETTNASSPDSSAWAYKQAQYKSLPVAGTTVTGINPLVVGNATCLAVVEVLPTGLNVHGKKYLTSLTEAALNALRT